MEAERAKREARSAEEQFHALRRGSTLVPPRFHPMSASLPHRLCLASAPVLPRWAWRRRADGPRTPPELTRARALPHYRRQRIATRGGAAGALTAEARGDSVAEAHVRMQQAERCAGAWI